MADGYISQIKTPDNKTYLLKDSEKTDEKVSQTSNSENKEFPIILKNTNNTTNETAGVKYAGGVTVNPDNETITAQEFKGNLNITNLIPISTKTYTTALYNTSTGANHYQNFMIVEPTDYNAIWIIHYRLMVTAAGHSDYTAYYDCSLSGRANTYYSYKFYNSFVNYPIYYHMYLRSNSASTPHEIGVRIASSYGADTVQKTIKVELLEQINCTATLLDSLKLYTSDLPSGYAGWVTFNATSNGLQETGDNDTTGRDYSHSGYGINGPNFRLPPYTIFGYDKNQKAQGISLYESGYASSTTAISTTRVYNTAGFAWEKGLWFSNSGTNFAPNANLDFSPAEFYYATDMRYTDNVYLNKTTASELGIVARKPLYFRGTIGNDGLFYLAPITVTHNNTNYQRVWTQDIPDSDDGYVYWFIGYAYYSSSYAASGYQVNLVTENKLYWFHNGRFQEYLPASTVAWADITNKPSTATSWPNWNQIQQNGANSIEEGTSDATANTEILTSYASNNGFADTNGLGKVYRRDASKIVNATLVKAALGTNATHGGAFLRKDGTWIIPPDTNKYHKSGSWNGLTYTATAVNSADELKFTIPNKIQTNWELNATSGNSPALLFTRDGTLTDWKIFVTSGKLSFQSATDGSTWTERAYFKDNSGELVLNSIQFGNNTSNYINNSFYTGKSRFSYHASAAHASINTSGSGWLKVKIKKKASWMLTFTIRLYTSYSYYDYAISGYNYGGNHWYSPTAVLLGSNNTNNRTVKFGYDDDAESGYCTLWVAVQAGDYYGIDIFNVTNGHSQYISDIENMFEIIHEDELTGTQQGNDQTIYGPWRRNETVANATTAGNISGTLALANLTKGDANTALMGKGSSTAPAYVSVSPSISITDGTADNAPKVNLTVLGVSGTTAQELTKATTGVYGATKLSNAIDSSSEVLAATPKAVKAAYDQATSALTTANNLLATADAMVFKGTLGTGGTITAVPTGASGKEYQAGYTYKVITDGTYAGNVCEAGDLLIAIADSTSGQTAVNNAHWTVVQSNLERYIHYYNNHDNNIDSLIAIPYLQTAAANGGNWSGTKPSDSHNGVALFNFQTHSGNYYTQLALDTSQNRLWLRSANNATTFGTWAKIATIADIEALDVSNISGFGTTKTLKTLTQADGKIAATFQDIAFPVTSVAGKTGAVTLAKGDVGLGNVDNTADANKSVNYATSAGSCTGNAANVTGIVAIANGGTGATTASDARDALFPLTSFTKSITLSNTWQNLGITGADLDTNGTYIIQIYLHSTGTGSLSSYNEYYSGIMSWFKTATNSTDYDEIPLHKAGHASNGKNIYLRTQRVGTNTSPNTLQLQIKASTNTTIAAEIQIKCRLII